MTKTTYYFLLLIVTILIIAFMYVYKNMDDLKTPKINTSEKESVKTQSVLYGTDSILFISIDKAELKEEPNNNSNTIVYLKKNSIFYVLEISDELDEVAINKKRSVKDYWYKITNYRDLTGWVFGYYTSKSDNSK